MPLAVLVVFTDAGEAMPGMGAPKASRDMRFVTMGESLTSNGEDERPAESVDALCLPETGKKDDEEEWEDVEPEPYMSREKNPMAEGQ